MGRPINLYSFMDIMNTTKDDQLINSMLRLCDDSIVHNPEQFFRKKELQNLYQFSEKLLPTLTNIPKADNYFIGYSVSIGITRQFDVLRFSTKKVVNAKRWIRSHKKAINKESAIFESLGQGNNLMYLYS